MTSHSLRQDPNPCRVIGVLDDGVASLSATALAHLRTADVVVGGTQLDIVSVVAACAAGSPAPVAMTNPADRVARILPSFMSSPRGAGLVLVLGQFWKYCSTRPIHSLAPTARQASLKS